jgi:hypothetical protein
LLAFFGTAMNHNETAASSAGRVRGQDIPIVQTVNK